VQLKELLQEKKPSGVHYYPAKLMQNIEESDWMEQEDVPEDDIELNMLIRTEFNLNHT
jgi:hypothetical protein